MRVVIVSPHLDDAVLSCGELIAQLSDCIVLTVFAGDDVDWSELREWDALSGFDADTNIVAARIAEDDASLAALGARGVRLDFLDAQYREPAISPSEETLGTAIAEAVSDLAADVVLIPLGLTHPDHRLAGAGGRHASTLLPGLRWIAYQDLPYGYEDDAAVAAALETLGPLVPAPIRLTDERQVEHKRAALDCYPSQMRTLGDRGDKALLPERYWQLATTTDDA
jgi:LmbE family N-acetylglucosaminyl deacetylase